MSHNISVIVPVYNAESSLEELYSRLKKCLKEKADHFEIILIDDCSLDSSWDVIRQLKAKDHRIVGIRLNRNFGQHNALLCGIRKARYEIIVTLDDDLQNPPEEIPKLLEELEKGHDVVYGTPYREKHSFWRNAASKFTKIILKGILGAETAKKVSAFRAFRSGLREAFANYQGSFVSIDVLLSWGTKRFSSIPVDHNARHSGRSHYSLMKLINHALNMMTGFSGLPLQFASLIGFFFTLFGVTVFIYVLMRYFIEGVKVPGFAFLASIIAIFSGAQLFALGIIGEYLSRIYFRTMAKPPYVIQTEDEGTLSNE